MLARTDAVDYFDRRMIRYVNATIYGVSGMSAPRKQPLSEIERVSVYGKTDQGARRMDSFAELSVVALRHPARTFDDEPIPAGRVGTIVFVHGGGEAYDVEFDDPVGLACVAAADLTMVQPWRKN